MSNYDLNAYVQDAVRTESKIDNVLADPELLAGAMQIFIAAGNMLDQIKKNAFYGKEINTADLVQEFMNIVASLDQIKPALSQEHPPQQVFIDPRVFHALIGIATESTELMEALAKVFSGEDLDNVNVLEEIGDLGFYQAIGIDALGGDFGDVLDKNMEKRRLRFPVEYTDEGALDRDLDGEREILNQLNDDTLEQPK